MSGLLARPADARALLVLAHGAGAGMEHPFMRAMADRLADRSVATLRFEFGYMAAGRRRPDRAPALVAAVRAAMDEAHERAGDLPLFAGGKSMGGRMTSTAQASEPRLTAPDGASPLRGLVFIGFPLHPAGKPGTERAAHLAEVDLPMLFVQGTRDALADLELLRPVLAGLAAPVTLHIEEGADHGFHVLKRSGRTDEQVLDGIADAVTDWIDRRLEENAS